MSMNDGDEALALIRKACKLAREVESHLPHLIENQPHFLITPCEEIVRVFNMAMFLLGSHCHNSPPPPPFAGMFLGESLDHRQELGVAGSRDLLTDVPHTQPMDLIHALGAGVFPTNEMGHLLELGLEPPAGYLGSGDEESFQGLRGSGDVQAMGSPTARGPSLQRLRTRKDGQETFTKRVAAPLLLTSNAEMAPEDGYTWRKYGQKVILHSTFPRSYYRCAYKSTCGCDAKKKVQRLDDEPYIFQVTYQGRHTCQTPPLLSSSSSATRAAAVAESSRAQALPPSLSLSRTSTQLGSWVSATEELEVDQGEENAPAQAHVPTHTQGQEVGEPSHVRQGNELDGLDNFFADIFNSGSSDNSIDSIFSPN